MLMEFTVQSCTFDCFLYLILPDVSLSLLLLISDTMTRVYIRFLSEFVREDMSDKAFAYLAPNLLPALFSIFTNPASNVELRSGAVGIIGEFVQVIYMVKEEHPEGKRSLLHYQL